ncbi:uncharacterized protein [Drosophila virilis]|uniref:Major facilitator superfamily (MFS) profile domain-containing protein n=1 Tax=Drosophila virilis TaxID=7244 RepID=A0A0Q9WJI3_DROVI|nr:uncharacterized protein LOC6623782 [Drosophila virilis]KRF84746.1 uncharacterized protein Dvir_GJ11717 [Drosophila virilis]
MQYKNKMKSDKYLPPEAPAYGFPSAPSETPQDCQPPGYSQQEYHRYGYSQATQNVFPQRTQPQQVYTQHPHPPPLQSFGPLPPHTYGLPKPPQPPAQSIVQVRPSGCFNRDKTNRPQMNVLSAATLIFISGGMNIAWSIGFRRTVYLYLTTHLRIAWFIGAIIGAAISGFVPKMVPKRAITLFCSMLVLISGILNASTHQNMDALTAALYLNGIANGLVLAPTLALAGELAGSAGSSHSYWETMWSFIPFGACRLLGSFIACFWMDSIGRKKSTLLGLVACGGLAFGIASQFHHPIYNGVTIMLDIFQLFAGVAFAASSAYLAEAYPLIVKQHFISVTFIVELLVFIIISTCDITNEFFYVIGGIYTAVFIMAMWCLPETQRTTLRESQKKFRGCC